MITDNKIYKCSVCRNKMDLYLDDLFDDRYGAPGRYSIYKCFSCGFSRLFPILPKQKIGRFYAKYYPLAFQTAESVQNSAKTPKYFWDWFNGTNNTAHRYIKPGKTVLDIGCGCGVSLLEIEKLGGSAFGVEPDPNAQKIAKKLKLHIHQGFITDNLFPGIKFDDITASQVIEHDPDPRTFLLSAGKKLKENGKIIMSFPNANSVYRMLFGRKWINWHVPYHCNFFTEKSFTRLAELSGFKIREIKTITPNLWTILQVRMLLAKPEEGKANPVWSVKPQSSQTHPSFVSLLKRKFMTSIIILVSLLIIPVNRIVDLFGQGDSFLVIMEKNYDR